MERKFTDEDIEALAKALKSQETDSHLCRFNDIDPAALAEAVKFYKHFNQIMAEGGKTIRTAILVLGVGGIVTLISIGIMSKLKTPLGP